MCILHLVLVDLYKDLFLGKLCLLNVFLIFSEHIENVTPKFWCYFFASPIVLSGGKTSTKFRAQVFASQTEQQLRNNGQEFRVRKRRKGQSEGGEWELGGRGFETEAVEEQRREDIEPGEAAGSLYK